MNWFQTDSAKTGLPRKIILFRKDRLVILSLKKCTQEPHLSDHKSRQIAQYCIRIINHGRSCSLHLFRQRFDSNGRGRGMEGRRDTRDLPILWPTPSSNGFLLTSPSAVPVGREGATSPLSPRQNIFRIIILHFQKSEFNPHRLN